MKNLAVFVSGSGTNLENLAVKIETGELKHCQIELVVCDQLQALALKRAEKHHLKAFVLENKNFPAKRDFEKAIVKKLRAHQIDYILLAGFMRILSSEFVKEFEWKIINVHPALLPKFPGAHAIEDAWKAKVKETGVTVHFVDSGIDTGPVIFQESMKVLPTDTRPSLEERIHQLEYALYPKAVQLLVDGKLSLQRGQVVALN